MSRVLMVCTGNICRSPLAEGLMRRELEKRGLNESSVSSAGTGAWDGAPASEGAYLVGLENGIDLTSHRARSLTSKLVGESDLILTMTRRQKDHAEELGGHGRAHVLGEFARESGPDTEVPDPFGAGIDVYRDTFEHLEGLIELAAERIVGDRGAAD